MAMKRFDPASIQSRIITSLQEYVDVSGKKIWTKVLNDSAIQSLVSAIAEDSAEQARYFEYLLKEAMWDLRTNRSSAVRQMSLFGYRPHRKISSIGDIYVSKDSLMASAGVDLFLKVDTTVDEFGVETVTESFVDSDGNVITLTAPGGLASTSIPKGTVVSTGSVQFITTESVSYTSTDTYLVIPVMQGIVRSFVSPVGALGLANEAIELDNTLYNIEAAIDDTSGSFFEVWVTPVGGVRTPVTIYENTLLAAHDEWACHVRTADDFSSITITFGDGVAGRKLSRDAIVSVQFVDTLGSLGNLTEDNSIIGFTDPAFAGIYCTNFQPLQGGKDYETLDHIRELGPQYYLLGDRSIVTTAAYVANLESIAYVLKANVSSDDYEDPNTGVTQKAILFTGFDLKGNKLVAADIERDFTLRTVDRRSPLDLLVYENPNPLLMNIAIAAATPLPGQNLETIASVIKSKILEEFSLESVDFENSYDSTAWGSLAEAAASAYLLHYIEVFTEAVIELLPSDFVVSNSPAQYQHTFMFDVAFGNMKNLTAHPYCLKIQIKFLCEACEDSSRTLFLITNDDYPAVQGSVPYRLVQYPYIDAVTSASYVAGSVLNTEVEPSEILPGDDDYVNFSVEINYIREPRLYEGRLAIPLKFGPGNTLDYVNFLNPNDDMLNETVSIKIMAIPENLYGTSLEYKDIFYTDSDSIQLEIREEA